ncbi:MAG: A/G-specific adenine glycosylase [Ignavibacteriales bacterium]|nr:A/G-specific adenine glycosylase [Ignavibacteriales bacterium]
MRLVHRKLLRWYETSGRPLPWRKTRNPYKILVSEIMLQQTQVSRVLQHYPRFIKKYPNFHSLSRVGVAEVLRAWRGLGYNNRAVRLLNLARTVDGLHEGILPRSIEHLRSLPGIGHYTAHAIACFAFGAKVPVVETNIGRVLARLFPSRQNVWETAGRILPPRRVFEWNQGLMDLGALICTPHLPDCGHCPLRDLCPTAHRVVRPAMKKRKEPGRNGIPNRIYRGKIIEVLRNRNGRGSIAAERLGSLIKPDFSVRDRIWLRGLLRSLEKDGLVRVGRWRGGVSVSFP